MGMETKNFCADVLFNSTKQPQYLLGTTEDGYIIVERSDSTRENIATASYRFCECGEGNPYEKYMDNVKFYDGGINYYIEVEGTSKSSSSEEEFYNLNTMTYTTVVLSVRKSTDEAPANNNTKATTTYTLPGNYDNLRRCAFGYNNDDTCSAVATEIALNYIALKNNMAIIPNNLVPEMIDAGNATSASGVQTTYKNAYNLHRYIADTCGMGPVSYALGIKDPFNVYVESAIPSMYRNRYNLGMNWTYFPKAATIKSNIQSGKPVLITTTFWGDLEWHTMCVYGYRDTPDGAQILVHVGWWSENELISGQKYKQKLRWVNESVATLGYYFSFSNPLAAYVDIPKFNTWAFPGIYYVIVNGLMNGTSSSNFSPNQTMTRAMFVTTLYRMAGSPSVTYQNKFSDVPNNQWYTNAVIWATNSGIANGVGNGLFEPDGLLSREQIAVFLFRYANYRGYNTSGRANLTIFSDYNSISSYARTAMSWAVYEGIINGEIRNSKRYLDPRASAIRSQVATMLMRFDTKY